MESIKSKVPSSELETLDFNFHIWVVPDQPFYISIWTKRSLQTRHIINSWLCSVLGCWLVHLITCKKLKYDCVYPTFATPHTLSKSHLENYPLFSIYLLDCRTRNLIRIGRTAMWSWNDGYLLDNISLHYINVNNEKRRPVNTLSSQRVWKRVPQWIPALFCGTIVSIART